MRRIERKVTDLCEIKKVLEAGGVIHVGMIDGNKPYVVPMHYGYEVVDGSVTLYLHSAKEGRKVDVIRANPDVFVVIETPFEIITSDGAPCAYSTAYFSFMADGKATFVENIEEKVKALSLLMKTQTGHRFEITPQMANGVEIIRIGTYNLSAKRNQRHDNSRNGIGNESD